MCGLARNVWAHWREMSVALAGLYVDMFNNSKLVICRQACILLHSRFYYTSEPLHRWFYYISEPLHRWFYYISEPLHSRFYYTSEPCIVVFITLQNHCIVGFITLQSKFAPSKNDIADMQVAQTYKLFLLHFKAKVRYPR
jgi:hypothetical protein